MFVHESHQGKFLVEDHLLEQRGLVVEEMGLHVAPHVREPPELVHVPQQQVVSFILLCCACSHTHMHAHTHKQLKAKKTRGSALQFESTVKHYADGGQTV